MGIKCPTCGYELCDEPEKCDECRRLVEAGLKAACKAHVVVQGTHRGDE